MRKITGLVIFVLILLNPGVKHVTGQKNTEDRLKKRGRTIQLFDGKSLDGWYTYIKDRGRNIDPKEVFTVKDGMIRISGEEWGSLTSTRKYENYRLVTEFKWGEKTFEPRLDKARDSGILIHSIGEDGASGGTWMHSIECQLIEGGTGDIIIVGDGTANFSVTSAVAEKKQGNTFVFEPGGQLKTINSGRINWLGRDANWKDTVGFRGKDDVENPVGEWNTLECIADGDRFTIYLNNVLVNEATGVKPQSGRIQIQSEGAELFFRKVEITFLSRSSSKN
jgi:hypothetical protein